MALAFVADFAFVSGWCRFWRSVVNHLDVSVSWNSWRALTFASLSSPDDDFLASSFLFNPFFSSFFLSSFVMDFFLSFLARVDWHWKEEGGVVHRLTYFYGNIFSFDYVVTSIHRYMYLFWYFAECFCGHGIVWPPTPHAASSLHHLFAN